MSVPVFRCLPHWMPLPSIRSVWQHMARHAQRISGAQVLKPSHTAVGFIQQSILCPKSLGIFCTFLLSAGHMLNLRLQVRSVVSLDTSR